MTQGIDVNASGWENPEGFKPRERDYVPPAPVACEAQGPDGWVCDLALEHPGNAHHADGGPTWPMEGQTLSSVEEITYSVDASGAQAQIIAIRETAQAALANPAPASWALALSQIVEMTRGY